MDVFEYLVLFPLLSSSLSLEDPLFAVGSLLYQPPFQFCLVGSFQLHSRHECSGMDASGDVQFAWEDVRSERGK